MWWWKWSFEKRLVKEKVAEKGWLCGMEQRMLQVLVVRFWKQGLERSVKAAKLVGLGRERCGAMVAAIEQWRWRAVGELQDVWYGVQGLQQCMLRMWLRMWKGSKVRKALAVSGGLKANSIAARYIELVDRHGYSFSAAAWKLVEEGEEKRIVLEMGQQIKEYRKQWCVVSLASNN